MNTTALAVRTTADATEQTCFGRRDGVSSCRMECLEVIGQFITTRSQTSRQMRFPARRQTVGSDGLRNLPNSNRIFGGGTPLGYMIQGGLPGMSTVRCLLDARQVGL